MTAAVIHFTPAQPKTEQTLREQLASAKEIPFTTHNLALALKSQRPVFAYFTADWCVTCKVNERVAIEIPSTQALIKDRDILVVVGDWTSQNEQIAQFLAANGRAGVPFYVYYPDPNDRRKFKILPQILTPQLMKAALDGSS